MKRKTKLLFVLLLVFFTTKGAQPTYIDTLTPPSNTQAYSFTIKNLPSLQGPAAFYSYLWWMGDNGYSFSASPDYAFQASRVNKPIFVNSVTTGNYSTGGPPPLSYYIEPTRGVFNPISFFPNNQQNLDIHHYRNAVIDDTLYLIVNYKVPHSLPQNGNYSGSISIDIPSSVSLVSNFVNNQNTLLPNGEVFNGSNEWSFQNLNANEERSILIPVKINPSEEKELNFPVQLIIDKYSNEEKIEGVTYSSVTVNIAESHDPNQMLAYDEAKFDCDYGGKAIDYVVQFQNVGKVSTNYVKVVCHLDEKLDFNSIDNVNFKIPDVYQGVISTAQNAGNNPQRATYEIDAANHILTFDFFGLFLLSPEDPNCTNLDLTRDQVEFTINLLPNYRFGDPVVSSAEIIFDINPSIVTNETAVICGDPLPLNNGGGFYNTSPPWNTTYTVTAVLVVVLGGLIGMVRKRRKR